MGLPSRHMICHVSHVQLATLILINEVIEVMSLRMGLQVTVSLFRIPARHRAKAPGTGVRSTTLRITSTETLD